MQKKIRLRVSKKQKRGVDCPNPEEIGVQKMGDKVKGSKSSENMAMAKRRGTGN